MPSERALKCAQAWYLPGASPTAPLQLAEHIDRHFPVPPIGKEAEAAAGGIVVEILGIASMWHSLIEKHIARAYADRIGRLERVADCAVGVVEQLNAGAPGSALVTLPYLEAALAALVRFEERRRETFSQFTKSQST